MYVLVWAVLTAWFGHCGGLGVTFEVGDIFVFGSWDLDLGLGIWIWILSI